MNIGVIDLIIISVAVAVFLMPLIIGYIGFGRPDQRHPLLKKALMSMAGLQLVVLSYFGWTFTAEKLRHVNHWKWIAPLIFVDLLMWVCFGIGFGAAVLRHRIKSKV